MCSDPDVQWYSERRVCYPSMYLAALNAQYDRLHKDVGFHDGTFNEWGPVRDEAHPFGHRDGVELAVTREPNDDEDFLTLSRGGDTDGDPS